jgi:hypothetical protein
MISSYVGVTAGMEVRDGGQGYSISSGYGHLVSSIGFVSLLSHVNSQFTMNDSGRTIIGE